MYKRFSALFVCFFLLALSVFISCRNKIIHNTVVVHMGTEPGNMNPLLFNNENAVIINEKIFQPLVGLDHATMKPVPVIADTFAKTHTDADGALYFSYRIKKDARWDNGDPITAADVEFSLKLDIYGPIGDKRLKPYYENVSDFITDVKDPKAFTIVFKETYILAEQAANEITVYPRYYFDKENVLGRYPLKAFASKKKSIENDAFITKYVEWINNKAFENDTTSLVGSGPYKLIQHKANTKLVLRRKDKWWGDNYNDRNDFFRAYPTTITYKIIQDPVSALVALKAGEVDVMHGLKAKAYIDLVGDKNMAGKFYLFSPQSLMLTYMGMNNKSPKFEDVRVRQAMCHLINVQRIINVVNYGLATQINGPVLPVKKGAYNDTLKPYNFDVEKARRLLATAGWADTDGDGIADKIISGKRVPFTIDFIYNAGNEARRDAIRIFKEDAAQAGIDVHVVAQEANVYSQNLRTHNFDMCYSGFPVGSYPDDFKQIFYSSSIEGSSNYVNYTSKACDKLLDEIRVTIDTAARNDKYKQLQVVLHNDAPVAFMFQVTDRVAINKKYSGVKPSALRPGFWEPGFRVTEQ